MVSFQLDDGPTFFSPIGAGDEDDRQSLNDSSHLRPSMPISSQTTRSMTIAVTIEQITLTSNGNHAVEDVAPGG
jgi:hypothetical protein